MSVVWISSLSSSPSLICQPRLSGYLLDIYLYWAFLQHLNSMCPCHESVEITEKCLKGLLKMTATSSLQSADPHELKG